MWNKVKERQGSHIVHIVYHRLVLYLTTHYSLYILKSALKSELIPTLWLAILKKKEEKQKNSS